MMKNSSETFELLSNLLSEKNQPKTVYDEMYEKLYSTVIQELSVSLNRSSYPEKTRLISDLKDVIDSVEILTQFPELIGKNIIGILGSKSKINDALLNKIGTDKTKIYKFSKNVPSIIYNGTANERVKAVNLLENIAEITRDNFIKTNRELYKKNIDIRQFLLAFSISAEMPYESLSFINFPYYSLKSQAYYSSLIDATDIIIIPVDTDGKWQEDLKYFASMAKSKKICLVCDDTELNNISKNVSDNFSRHLFEGDLKALNESNINTSMVITCTISVFLIATKKLDCIRNNVAIEERFISIVNRYRIYQNERIVKIKNSISGMNSDLINIGNEETRNSVREVKKQLDETLEAAFKELSDFQVITDKLLEAVGEFENSLYEKSKVLDKEQDNEIHLYHGEYEKNCSNLILDFIQIGDFISARKYIARLENHDFQYAYIYELYMDKKMNRDFSSAGLNKLCNEMSNEDLVKRAKVRFSDYLNINEEELGDLLQTLNGPLDGYEYYKFGEYYSSRNVTKAKEFFRKSLDKGCLEAGDELIKYIDSYDYLELEPLTKMLVPEANYQCGLMCLEYGKYAKGVTFLKVAAVFEHVGAITKLANMEFSNASKKYWNSDVRTKKSINIAFKLFSYLHTIDSQNTNVKEKLGQIYYWKDDYRKSRSLLEKCDTKDALYICGRMYQYGNGVAKDIYKARDLFEKAYKKGHKKAQVEYEKVCGWIESNNTSASYSSSSNYSSSSSYSYDSGSSGWCFLTTATCLALGKSDDCEELNALRKYRDEYLILDEDGAEIIREYYRVAPLILKSVENDKSSTDLFKSLYNDYIAIICDDLRNNNHLKAKKAYIEMVRNLCHKYDVDLRYSGAM